MSYDPGTDFSEFDAPYPGQEQEGQEEQDPTERIAHALERIAVAFERGATVQRTPGGYQVQPRPQPVAQNQYPPQQPYPQQQNQAQYQNGGADTGGWRCPLHGQAKIVPAGVSQRTGQPYSSFVACPVRGCPERPPRGY